MNYPPYYSSSGNSVSDTLENLILLRRSLLQLLSNNNVMEMHKPLHSLFSSKRNFRADELHSGHNAAITAFGFSKN